MSSAFKCDLCRKHYEGYTFLSGRYDTKSISVNCKSTRRRSTGACTAYKCYDVCPDCYLKFMQFVKSIKKGEDEWWMD